MEVQIVIFLILFTVVGGMLSLFLFFSGKFLIHLKDYQKDMEHYKKERMTYPLVERFFLDVLYVFTILDRRPITQQWFKSSFLTKVYRVTGYVYLGFSFLFAFGIVFVWLNIFGIIQ